MLHTAKRLKWVDEGYEMLVFTDDSYQSKDQTEILLKALSCADILLIVAVTDQESVKWIETESKIVPNIVCFDSSPNLVNKLGGSYVQNENSGTLFAKTFGISPSKKASDSMDVEQTVSEAWKRHNSDDIRKALQCLNKCSPVDQKNNCLELDAKIPEKPFVPPMAKFRGEDLSHETAEDLFVGWLGSLDWSWRVVAGQNPAYDQFPCQYQLFYRGKAKDSFWYEPVFQVKTLEGKVVWRRRKYRVKRGKIPGTFYFSVLDNGVVSNEHWTIVDVSDDFSWGLFHYNGAARVAGQAYTGAVLASPDGAYPDEKESKRLASALEKCGIKEWELFTVDNCSCQDPPLGLPEGSSLHSAIDVKVQKWNST
ncbi:VIOLAXANTHIN DE-EPOXIDASE CHLOROPLASTIC-RELATED [Salix purpurea]|uniref:VIOLAXANTHIN DE-EPOXIDASE CHLOROPLASTIC-RELATED n=1 Tax=Salix purpurea TaxID=77065 RepID=A0A9Q0WXF8_SALPP|nr:VIOLAXANTHIN DE-EPOXIDASE CHLOROPLASTIC-RELATED [Salix purpurea]